MLHELVYVSAAVPRDISEATLTSILEASHRHNTQHAITGVLLHENGQFIQLIEGEYEAVRHLYYDMIVKDPSHRDLRVVVERPVTSRSFDTWSMGFVRLADLHAETGLNLTGYLAGGVESLDLANSESYGRRLLGALYRQTRASHTWGRLFCGRTNA